MSFQSRFNFLHKLPGQIYREQPGRLTKSIQLNDQDCFVKLHFGIGWKEIVKNLLQGRLPILGAKTEYTALQKLASLGISTLEPIEFAEQGLNPATQHSYLVTKALKNTVSLEDLSATWNEKPPTLKFKRQLIREIAAIAGTIHAHGLNHRDFYICHFLFDVAYYEQCQKIKLYLIDLHRAQIRDKTPWRWQVKDIAGLYFSALNLPLTRRDLFCFMQVYGASFQPWMAGIHDQGWKANCPPWLWVPAIHGRNDAAHRFWYAVEKKAWLLYEKTYFKKHETWLQKVIFDSSLSAEFVQDVLAHLDQLIDRGEILKEDATTTVAKIDEVVLKRYNVRDFVKGIKRFFKQSRARRCWLQALRLRHLNIATPKPLLMLERLRFGLVRESCIATNYLHGQDLMVFLRQHPEQLTDITQQIQIIFKTLKDIGTAHGDFKATNLWVVNNKIYLLDLDGVRHYKNTQKFERALAKDKKRFLKNWLNEQKYYEHFKQALQ